MPILINIGFDNPKRLRRNVYYFTYAGVRFKLIQGHPQTRDVLLTIVSSAEDKAASQRVYAAAGEFLSALSWANESAIAFDYVGHFGAKEGFPLRKANTRWTGPPRVPNRGHMLGFNIDPIPSIETPEQRLALAMFREALSSNNVLLSFLLCWQVLEIGQSTNAVGWVNKTWSQPPTGFRVPTSDIQRLPLAHKRLGEYLLDDCRGAIAHIRREPGRRALRFDDIEEVARLAFSTRVVRQFARYYVQRDLGLDKKMYLVRRDGRGFPEYVEASLLSRGSFRRAYDPSSAPVKQPRLRRPPFRQTAALRRPR